MLTKDQTTTFFIHIFAVVIILLYLRIWFYYNFKYFSYPKLTFENCNLHPNEFFLIFFQNFRFIVKMI